MSNSHIAADSQSVMVQGEPKTQALAQSQNLIFVLTSYALDPNRSILTRLLIDLDRKFMFLPIERFFQSAVKIAKTDLILIDAVHLSQAGCASRVPQPHVPHQEIGVSHRELARPSRPVPAFPGRNHVHPTPAAPWSKGQRLCRLK